MEALMVLDCSNYSKNMVDVLKLFQQVKWELYNSEGKIEYLPVGDNDEYNWQCEVMSESRFYDIVIEKIAYKELVGVNLFYKEGNIGISFLANDTSHIMLELTINRKTIDGKHTDLVWYLKEIVYNFFDLGVRVLSYKLEEFED